MFGEFKQLRMVRSLAMRAVREKWHVLRVKEIDFICRQIGAT